MGSVLYGNVHACITTWKVGDVLMIGDAIVHSSHAFDPLASNGAHGNERVAFAPLYEVTFTFSSDGDSPGALMPHLSSTTT